MSTLSNISFELDAREILKYLNDLGIRNISGEVLRDFIIDLKKLIKYDLYYKNRNLPFGDIVEDEEPKGPERLHSATTFSSRCRSRVNVKNGNQFECCRHSRRQFNSGDREKLSKHIVPPKDDHNDNRRECLCEKKKSSDNTKGLKSASSIKSCANFIRVPIKNVSKKTDPVSLYHHYMTLWEKYKPNVPGENNWSDLRWAIRQRLIGETTSKVTKKVSFPSDKELAKRRQTWVD